MMGFIIHFFSCQVSSSQTLRDPEHLWKKRNWKGSLYFCLSFYQKVLLKRCQWRTFILLNSRRVFWLSILIERRRPWVVIWLLCILIFNSVLWCSSRFCSGSSYFCLRYFASPLVDDMSFKVPFYYLYADDVIFNLQNTTKIEVLSSFDLGNRSQEVNFVLEYFIISHKIHQQMKFAQFSLWIVDVKITFRCWLKSNIHMMMRIILYDRKLQNSN